MQQVRSAPQHQRQPQRSEPKQTSYGTRKALPSNEETSTQVEEVSLLPPAVAKPRSTNPFIRFLDSILGVMHTESAHQRAQNAEMEARRTKNELEYEQRFVTAKLETSEARIKIILHRRLLTADPEEREALCLEAQQLEAARKQYIELLRSIRPEEAVPTPPITTYISDQAIEQAAVRAVSRIGSLPAAEAEQAWVDWEKGLSAKYPLYAVHEIKKRASELREHL